MKQEFNDYEWHDAELLSINIDRSDPGHKDEVVLVIRWLDEKISELIFCDCWAMDAKLNFGTIALETIWRAEYTECSDELNELRRSWSSIGADLSDVGQFQIETNSTHSTLTIFARGFVEKRK